MATSNGVRKKQVKLVVTFLAPEILRLVVHSRKGVGKEQVTRGIFERRKK